MSHVNALYHIVFATHERCLTITNDFREDLYRFIWKIISDKGCKLLRIGGIPNHIHILLGLNATVALSDLIREIKAKSSGWMKKDPRFPLFNGWAKEYFAASVSFADRINVIEYIKNQQIHHTTKDYSKELSELFAKERMELTKYDL